MTVKREKIKKNLKKLLSFVFNPRLILCFFIAWMITNGWSYIFTLVGGFFDITWMFIVGTAYASLLWLPFTPEKIVTVIIAIFLLKLMFPKDKKTLSVLRTEYRKAKISFKIFWNRLRTKRKGKSN